MSDNKKYNSPKVKNKKNTINNDPDFITPVRSNENVVLQCPPPPRKKSKLTDPIIIYDLPFSPLDLLQEKIKDAEVKESLSKLKNYCKGIDSDFERGSFIEGIKIFLLSDNDNLFKKN